MTRYIAIPKRNSASSALNLAEVSVNPERRSAQVGRMLDVRKSLSNRGTLEDIAETATKRNASVLASPEHGAPVTGATVFDSDDPDIVRQINEVSDDYDIIEDFALDLIKPVEDIEGSAASTISTDLWHLDAIGLTDARDNGFTGTGAGVGVAVLDSGLAETPEIAGKIKSVYVQDASRAQFVAQDVSKAKDTTTHGTEVASLVAGNTVGVAPGAELCGVTMIPYNQGRAWSFISAVELVASLPEISVINMSAGVTGGLNKFMADVVASALSVGVFMAVAIGNEGRNTSRSPGNYSNVTSVGATRRNGRVASFSGGGQIIDNGRAYYVPDLVAPGHRVTTMTVGGSYKKVNGTSFATPIVAGMAALVIENDPMISPADLSDELHFSLKTLRNQPQDRQGNGLLQMPEDLLPS